jgi:hypothetical protein
MNSQATTDIAKLMQKAQMAGAVMHESIVSLADPGVTLSRDICATNIFAAISSGLKERISRYSGNNLPRIVIMLGRCRVGSTALAQVFGESGIPSFYQPVKTMVRWSLVGKERNFWQEVIMDRQKIIAIKETIGPFTVTESAMDPVSILLEGGYPPELISVVFLDRDPEETLKSWFRIWDRFYERQTLLRNYLLASITFYRSLSECLGKVEMRLCGFPLDFGEHPQITMPRLFVALGLEERWSDRLLSGWGISDFRDSGSKIKFLGEPPEFLEQEVLRTRNRYLRIHRTDMPEIRGEERDAMDAHSLYDKYRNFILWSSKTLYDNRAK